MRLGKSDGVFAFAAAEFQNDRVVVLEKFVPAAFIWKAFGSDTLVRILEKVVECEVFGESLQFVFTAHDKDFYFWNKSQAVSSYSALIASSLGSASSFVGCPSYVTRHVFLFSLNMMTEVLKPLLIIDSLMEAAFASVAHEAPIMK